MTADASQFLLDGEKWMRLITAPEQDPRPALFLDRDGVMIEERAYLSAPADVALIPGCTELVRHASAQGFATIVITNQSGIGRGYFAWHDHLLVENRLIELLAADGASMDLFLANSEVPNEIGLRNIWRKPSPGMLVAAAEALNIDLARSIVVGDKASDLEAGRAAGLARGVHVLTGHGISQRDATHRLSKAGFLVTSLSSIGCVVAEL